MWRLLFLGGTAADVSGCPPPREAPGHGAQLPEIVARGDTALLRNAVQPGEGVSGDALVPGLVQIAHPADLNAQDSALEGEGAD